MNLREKILNLAMQRQHADPLANAYVQAACHGFDSDELVFNMVRELFVTKYALQTRLLNQLELAPPALVTFRPEKCEGLSGGKLPKVSQATVDAYREEKGRDLPFTNEIGYAIADRAQFFQDEQPVLFKMMQNLVSGPRRPDQGMPDERWMDFISKLYTLLKRQAESGDLP